MKRDGLFGDRERNERAFAHPDAIANFGGRAGRLDFRMDAPIEHQHRTRLGRIARRRRGAEKARRLHDSRAPDADIEYAIRPQVKIAGAFAQIRLVLLLAIFDEEADRRQIRFKHAAVHRKAKLAPLRLERVGEASKAAIGAAVGALPIDSDVVAAHIEGTDRVICAVEARWRTGRRRLRLSGRGEDHAEQQEAPRGIQVAQRSTRAGASRIRATERIAIARRKRWRRSNHESASARVMIGDSARR